MSSFWISFALLGSNRHVLNVLHTDAAQVGAFDVGYRPFNEFTSQIQKSTKLLFLLGADDRPLDRHSLHPGAFIIYQGFFARSSFCIAKKILMNSKITDNYRTPW